MSNSTVDIHVVRNWFRTTDLQMAKLALQLAGEAITEREKIGARLAKSRAARTAAPAAASAEAPRKRHRRTKAEMEAARAAQVGSTAGQVQAGSEAATPATELAEAEVESIA